MALTLVETRKISGKGILLIPTEAKGLRYYLLYAEVIRLPKQPYMNYNWNPARSRYASLCFLNSGYLVKTEVLEFPKQRFVEIPDIAGQVLLALKCVMDATNQTSINLGVALGVPPVSVNNPISDYKTLALMWDEIRVKCYADVAIGLRLYTDTYDSCQPGYIQSSGGGEPPSPLPQTSPGLPIADISRPYDEGTLDNGNSSPLGTDTIAPLPPPPTTGGQCEYFIVKYTYKLPNGNEQTQAEVGIWAPYGTMRISGASNNLVQLYCRGLAQQPCNVAGWYTIVTSSTFPLTAPRIVSVRQ